MVSNSIFSSDKSEKRWVLEVDKNFLEEQNMDIDFDTPTSVFQVPKTLTETKPEAYSPQQMGLGPYHHARPELYLMQKQKLAAIRKFLNQGKLHSFQQLVNALVQYEPVLRACYDLYLDLDIETLARILAIDGLYMLQFLESYSDNENSEIKEVIGDILMLENQIPVILLEKITRVLQFNHGEYDDNLLFKKFQTICLGESPLKLNEQREINKYKNQLHLMHRMYYLIVNNRGLKDPEPESEEGPTIEMEASMLLSVLDEAYNVMEFLEQQGVPAAAPVHQILSFMEKIPWDRIIGLFKKQDHNRQNQRVEEIDIPSVSEMTEMAGMKFTLTHGGIRDIQFVEYRVEKIFYLPVCSLKPTSEIILRNLVAFEAVTMKPGSTREFAEYVDLMCGIIDSKKDVDILRKAEIIESELADEDIVNIFNGIRKSTGMNNKPQSEIERAIDAGKKQYDNVFSVKAKRFVELYGSAMMKFLKMVFYVLILVLLTWQAYCSAFGCSRWFRKGNTVQGGDKLLYSEYARFRIPWKISM